MDHTVDYSCIWIYTKILSLHSKIFRSIEQHSLHPGSEYQGRARGQRTQMARGAPQAHGRGGGGPRGGQPRTGHHHFKITKRFSSTGSQCFVMVGRSKLRGPASAAGSHSVGPRARGRSQILIFKTLRVSGRKSLYSIDPIS